MQLQKYNIILSETQIFPPIVFFTYLLDKSILQLEAHENYQKRSYRNRFLLGSQKGKVSLSIPLQSGKNKGLNIRKVRIDYNHPWQKKMISTIRTIYGKAPFFIYYIDEIERIVFLNVEYLFDFNKIALLSVLKMLQWDIPIQESTDFVSLVNENTLDFRNQLFPEKQSEQKLPAYEQVYSEMSGYIPGLSILDLLFHLGPESMGYLQKVSLNIKA